MAQHTTLEDAEEFDSEMEEGLGLDLKVLDEQLGTAPKRDTAKKTIVEVEEVEEEDEGLSVTVSRD